MKAKAITAETNRGMLLDLVVFLINLVLMNVLTQYSLELFRLAGEEDALAEFALLLCAGAMFILPAAGAVLKRWHFHQRLSARQKPDRQGALQNQEDLSSERGTRQPFNVLELKSNWVAGCLFNPIFYFVLSILLSSMVMSLLMSLIFGRQGQNKGGLFTTLVIATFVACVIQTVLVYRYFSPPKKAPSASFLRSPASEQVGDLCIFVNMILFQIFWNLAVNQFPFSGATTAGGHVLNFCVLIFFALLIYFPPRIFYLAEDIHRRTTWLTILLANSPTILRVLFGDSHAAGLIQ